MYEDLDLLGWDKKTNSQMNNSIIKVQNEICISNLFAAINNEMVFGSLDSETQKELIEILTRYTKHSIDGIILSGNPDAEEIKPYNLKK